MVRWHAKGDGLSVFTDGAFVPYTPESTRIAVVGRSAEWFGGHRGHLPPARTMAALTGGRQ
ncbi:MAG: hypothetical protein ACKOEX_06195 [Planctomycetia bacterium]